MNTIVDGRGKPPPQPFEMVMEALADMKSGDTLLFLIERVPHPLFRILDRDGYRYAYKIRDDQVVEVEIAAP